MVASACSGDDARAQPYSTQSAAIGESLAVLGWNISVTNLRINAERVLVDVDASPSQKDGPHAKPEDIRFTLVEMMCVISITGVLMAMSREPTARLINHARVNRAAYVIAGDLETLHVLSTRGDYFIPPEQCAGWQHRVSGEFHLAIVRGGHALDETTIGVLERAIDSVLAGLFSTLPGLETYLARQDGDPLPNRPPWPFARAEIESFANHGLHTVAIERPGHPAHPPRWRAEFIRPSLKHLR